MLVDTQRRVLFAWWLAKAGKWGSNITPAAVRVEISKTQKVLKLYFCTLCDIRTTLLATTTFVL
jgi:hypothetical protein